MIRDSAHAHRLARPRSLVLGAALLAALAGCGGGGDGSVETSTPSTGSPVTPRPEPSVGRPGTSTFRDDNFGITFDYPDDFERGEVTGSAETAGGEPVAETALALDEDNGIFVAKYVLTATVTEQNLEDVLPELDGLVRRLSGQQARGTTVELGGLPAVRYDDVGLTKPANGESRLVFVFDRNNEYLINCQSTPQERPRVDGACDQALATLAPT